MHTQISTIHRTGSLTVAQLGTPGRDVVEFAGLGKALDKKFIQVKEVDNAGSVNTIIVLNTSDQFVFLMDGDILAGAKQNRVVNTSMLLAPQSKTLVPVSCVEAGRWKHTSSTFGGTAYSAPATLRNDKARHVRQSLEEKRGFASNQGEIWGRVSEFEKVHQMSSATSNLSDIFDGKKSEFDEFIRGFAPDPKANGLAVFFGKSLASVDIFHRTDVYLEYFPKLLRGAAFESGTDTGANNLLEEAEVRYRVLELLDKFEEQEFTERPSVGVGTDRRFETPALAGFEIVYGGHVIHRAAFRSLHRTTKG